MKERLTFPRLTFETEVRLLAHLTAAVVTSSDIYTPRLVGPVQEAGRLLDEIYAEAEERQQKRQTPEDFL